MIKRIYVFIAFFISFLFIPLLGNGWGEKQKKIKVVCIGDSITYGARLKNRKKHSYPAQLQKLLGYNYEIKNFGESSCTLIRKGKPTVWNSLPKIKATNPDIVIICLGTNDTCGMGTCGDRKCWEYKDEFESDYCDLIDTLKTWPSQPRIWVCAPPPMVIETPDLSQKRIEDLAIRRQRLQKLIVTIKKVAEKKNVGFIDLNTPLSHRAELFTKKDGVHPNKKGYFVIGKLIYRKVIKEN